MSYSPGLEGVVAGVTAISNVEGDIGRLSYRGYDINELVTLPYLSVMWLVIFGDLPDDEQRADLDAFLKAHGKLNAEERRLLACVSPDVHPMRMLQGMIPLLNLDRSYHFDGLDEEASLGLQIIARFPELIAGFRQGESMTGSNTSESYLGNFLHLFTGQPVTPEREEVMTVVQILQMDHGFNAGTFTGRVIASTLAPVDSVISGAVGALFGILHGGADEAALMDAHRVGAPENAQKFVDDLLAGKGKLMGMGHREYRKVDPRALVLKPLARKFCEGTRFENDYRTLEALELCFNARMKEKGRDIWANVEFYKGAVYETLDIPPNYFTAMFAMARVVGWLAHFIEARADNKLIRPKVDYIGPASRSL